MKVLVKSAWRSDDPTKAAFPFLHSNALAEAGHDAQIFLLRDPVANAIVPVGWPPLAETLHRQMHWESTFTSEVPVRGPVGSWTQI